jgi:SAM-dependent methyltransferase
MVAERIGPDGTLISTDYVAEMVEAARRGAAARGLANVDFTVMDAHTIDLPEGSVDSVLCRFGLMLMPDPAAVLAGVRKILRPGGRFAYSVFGAPDRNPWITTMAGAIMACGHDIGADPFAPGGLFSLADPIRNRELTASAGFVDVHVDELVSSMCFDDLDDYWSFQSSISGRFALLLATLTEDERREIRHQFAELARPYTSNGRYELPNCVVAVSAG